MHALMHCNDYESQCWFQLSELQITLFLGSAHCMMHCYNSLPILVRHFQQVHILRQKVLLDLFGKRLCVEETGSEKCESHWSGVEN